VVPVAVVMTMAAGRLAARRSGTARRFGGAGRFGGSGTGRFGGSGARRFSGSAATTTTIEREQPSLGLGRGEAEQTDHQQGGQQSTEFHGFDSSNSQQ
jgi:hypothetical protein